MYKLLDIEDLKNECLWAHTKEGKKSETLLEHSQLCIDYYKEYCCYKGIDEIVYGLIRACGCNEMEAEVVYSMFVNAIYLHDVGKINPAYQARRLNNPMFKDNRIAYEGNSNHALPSAYIYMAEFMPLIEGQSKRKLSFFLFAFSYCIARHHGYLKNTDGFKDDIMNCPVQSYYRKILDLNKNSIVTTDRGYKRIKKYIENEVAFFILCKLLFATITTCDYCATAEYKSDTKIDIRVIDVNDLSIWKKNYQNGDIYKGIIKYQESKYFFNNNPINALRSDMFLEAEQRLKKFYNANIYYLEAPTGSGKTENSINLMLNILETNPKINNVFYIFPFNTLVEQTSETLEKYFEKDVDFAIVNSINPIVMKRDAETEEVDYEYSYLGRLFNNYPIVVTSHINLFNALFGCGKEQIFPLIKLCNSVVIIDEIQSYKNSIWRHIIIFLNAYAKLLNIKIIIMSATLPKLDKILDGVKAEFVSLIKEPRIYYENPLFRDRVRLDFSLLKYNKIDLETLAEKVIAHNGKKVLVEFISKTTARKFYDILSDIEGLYVIELTGDDNPKYRKEMIREIKNKESIIVVATQVIEAGIDIDMDVGFKDISILDAEEQFLGRINRSCKKTDSIAYFFNYDDTAKIYRGDIRTNYPITDNKIAAIIKSKNFESFYSKVISDLKDKTDRLNRNNINELFRLCLELRFDEIRNKMRLIDDSKQVFIAHQMETDEGIIDGQAIWEEYKRLCQDKELGYAQKKVYLSMIAEKMSYFTYTVYGMENMEIRCDEELGGYYYISNGDQYIRDGKFDREAFSKSMRGLFW